MSCQPTPRLRTHLVIEAAYLPAGRRPVAPSQRVLNSPQFAMQALLDPSIRKAEVLEKLVQVRSQLGRQRIEPIRADLLP